MVKTTYKPTKTILLPCYTKLIGKDYANIMNVTSSLMRVWLWAIVRLKHSCNLQRGMIDYLWLEAKTIKELNQKTLNLQRKFQKWPSVELNIIGVTSPREGHYMLHYTLDRPENVVATPPVQMSGILTRIGAM